MLSSECQRFLSLGPPVLPSHTVTVPFHLKQFFVSHVGKKDEREGSWVLTFLDDFSLCVYTCVYLHLCVYMLPCLWKRGVSIGVFHYWSAPYFLRRGPLLSLEFARLPPQQASGIIPRAGSTNMDHHVWLFTWGLGYRTHKLVLVYLLSHPSPQPVCDWA